MTTVRGDSPRWAWRAAIWFHAFMNLGRDPVPMEFEFVDGEGNALGPKTPEEVVQYLLTGKKLGTSNVVQSVPSPGVRGLLLRLIPPTAGLLVVAAVVQGCRGQDG